MPPSYKGLSTLSTSASDLVELEDLEVKASLGYISSLPQSQSFLFKSKQSGSWRMAQRFRALVRFLVPTWQLAPVCNSSSGESDTLTRAGQTPTHSK